MIEALAQVSLTPLLLLAALVVGGLLLRWYGRLAWLGLIMIWLALAIAALWFAANMTILTMSIAT